MVFCLVVTSVCALCMFSVGLLHQCACFAYFLSAGLLHHTSSLNVSDCFISVHALYIFCQIFTSVCAPPSFLSECLSSVPPRYFFVCLLRQCARFLLCFISVRHTLSKFLFDCYVSVRATCYFLWLLF